MSINLQKLNKKELLEIVGKMKKQELINIINIKQNGGTKNTQTISPIEMNVNYLSENTNTNTKKNSNEMKVNHYFSKENNKNKNYNAIITPLIFDPRLIKNENKVSVMSNNEIYNNIYNDRNKKNKNI